MSDIKISFTRNSIVLLVVTLIIGALLGFVIEDRFEANRYNDYFDSFKPKRVLNNKYNLVAPLIGVESNSATTVGRLAGLNSDVKSYIKNNQDKVDDYSIYFRDLNSTQWAGFNEDKGFIPASLLKIAVALTILKQEEADHDFANTKKVFTQQVADIEKELPFLEQSTLKIGESYDTEFLLNKMIIDSDNGAKDLLFSLVDKNMFFKLFKLIDVKQPTEVLKYEISSEDFSFFFRVLYSSTYLSVENSQRLLSILTKVNFEDGLVKGLPPHIIIAHKYGTFTLADDKGKETAIELHDCGIIYHQKHPYVLCVMTKGKDVNKLSEFIAGISAVVYKSAEEDFGDN